MIRVALSTSVVQRGRSGVATYIFGLLDGLRSIDAPVEVVLLGLAEDKPLFEKWLDRCQWVAVDEKFRPAVRNVFWHQTSLRGILRRERIDVLHVPSYRRIVAQPPCPQLVTIHDCAAFAVKGKYDVARMIYGKVIVRALARRVETITTVSHATARDVTQYFGIPADSIHVIWNGIDHHLFQRQQPDAVRAAMQRLGRQHPYFIYLARLEHPGKNHLHLIDEFERFCESHPESQHELLLGGADWHGAEAIHQRIASSSWKHRIHALGFVEKSDLPFWYAGATAMVYPSLFEGFGLPPVEAMACGCPVISSACGSLGEVVGEGARIIDPIEPGSIAQALADAASSPDCNADWIRRGFSRAAEFSWDKVAHVVCQLYKETALK